MITPYAGLHLLPRTLPRCAACADVIGVPDIAEIVSEYSGEKLVHDIHVPEMLLDLPIYNTPHKWADYSHPPWTYPRTVSCVTTSKSPQWI